MKRLPVISFFLVFPFILIFALSTPNETSKELKAPLSEKTEECVDCHNVYTPGIVEDWLTSEHARTTPAEALKKQGLEKKVSSKSIPEELLNVAVGCYECHGRNKAQHKDNFEHFESRINMIVTPNDCATCHSEEEEQYRGSKKANALHNLQKNPVYHTLVETITSRKEVKGTKIIQLESSDYTKAETCYACHGTRVEVKGMKILETDLGEIEVPELSNWPNQGVGRVNPDGSSGACTPCHPRHSFSIEIARKPDTCSQCHLEPDVPAWNVYRESKHGNIFYSKQSQWNWKNVPWVVGRDFKAPTCATCHNSLLTDLDGEVIIPRTHDFGARLWVRLFGLVYSHPQPKKGQTYMIKNKEGLPLPVTFTGELASEYLLDKHEQDKRQNKMKRLCQSCHSSTWTENHFTRLHSTINEADKMVLAATKLLLEAWKKGIADKSNPFDEAIEQRWIKQWLFYANSIRYASAMGGPDFAAFKNGWFELSKNLQEMKDFIELKSKK
jgi:hypothetical protein